MNRSRSLIVLAVLMALPACYHAVIETGRPASATVVTKPFQLSFIYGLIPPPALNVSAQCPTGVAKVETVHSFVEGLVAFLTFGILTPMSYIVTCASGRASLPAAATIDVAHGSSSAEQAAAFERAIELARTTGSPAYLKY